MNTQTLPALSLSGRTHYRSSGDINVTSFLLWLIPALAVAGILAALMHWLFHSGHYYIIIVPALGALAVAGMAAINSSRACWARCSESRFIWGRITWAWFPRSAQR
jgi:hypothetical protein